VAVYFQCVALATEIRGFYFYVASLIIFDEAFARKMMILLSGNQKWLLFFDLPSIHRGQGIRAYGGRTERGGFVIPSKATPR